ncbi:hypothetical protein HU200_051161 [Digitaria exilis]|uniref:Uncharacterized protein n=1 Tax=Digitaria exilis TaxID=1010633 RepID=A0A835B1J9_9POAL|nr:hypothetical protein HU200_051161 [Digitaria exilis]
MMYSTDAHPMMPGRRDSSVPRTDCTDRPCRSASSTAPARFAAMARQL